MGAARPGNFSLSAVDLISTWPVGIGTYNMRTVCITLLVCLYRYITYISYCSTHALLNPTVYRTASLSLRIRIAEIIITMSGRVGTSYAYTIHIVSYGYTRGTDRCEIYGTIVSQYCYFIERCVCTRYCAGDRLKTNSELSNQAYITICV